MSSTIERESDVERLDEQRREALSPEYWRTIRPKRTPTPAPLATRPTDFEDELRRGLDERGYVHLESLLHETRLNVASASDSTIMRRWSTTSPRPYTIHASAGRPSRPARPVS